MKNCARKWFSYSCTILIEVTLAQASPGLVVVLSKKSIVIKLRSSDHPFLAYSLRIPKPDSHAICDQSSFGLAFPTHQQESCRSMLKGPGILPSNWSQELPGFGRGFDDRGGFWASRYHQPSDMLPTGSEVGSGLANTR